MTTRDAETVRMAYERLSSGDVDGLLRLCTSDFEFRDLPALPGSGVFRGHEGFRAWYQQLLDAFDSLDFSLDAMTQDGGQVVVDSTASGRGKGSGAAVELHFVSVWTLDEGLIVQHVAYDDREAAAQAAG